MGYWFLISKMGLHFHIAIETFHFYYTEAPSLPHKTGLKLFKLQMNLIINYEEVSKMCCHIFKNEKWHKENLVFIQILFTFSSYILAKLNI